MRETGIVRKQMGDAESDSPYIGIARTQLGILKSNNPMGLQLLYRTIRLDDGTVIHVSSVHGRDTINIQTVPVERVPQELPAIEGGFVVPYDEPEFVKPQGYSKYTWLAASVISPSGVGSTYDPARGGKYSVETVDGSLLAVPMSGSVKVAKPVNGTTISTDNTTWLNLATGVPAGFKPSLQADTLSGADIAKFKPNADKVEFVAAPDYSAPTDANADNVYDLTIENDSERQDVKVGVKYFYVFTNSLVRPPVSFQISVNGTMFTVSTNQFFVTSQPTQVGFSDNSNPATYDTTGPIEFTIPNGFGIVFITANPTDNICIGGDIVSIGINSVIRRNGIIMPMAYTTTTSAMGGRPFFAHIPDAAQGIPYSNDGTTERFTLITDQQIWPLTQ